MFHVAGIPFFIWCAIIGVLSLYSGAVVMMVAKIKKQPQLRGYHYPLVSTGLLFVTTHALFAILLWVGLL